MEDWENALAEGLTPTRSCGQVLVPETPSPIFNRIHRSKMNTSPQRRPQSRKPLYFGEISGKHRIDADEKGKAAAYRDIKKQCAFEKLRAVRQKKYLKSQKSESPRADDRSSSTLCTWPSESESDAEAEQDSPFSTQHIRNDRRKTDGKSAVQVKLHRGGLETRIASSSSTDSPYLPLRKCIKLGHTEASGSNQVKLPVDDTDNQCPLETGAQKLDTPSTSKATSPCSDFISARQVMEDCGIEELALSSFVRDKNCGKLISHRIPLKSKGRGKYVKRDVHAAESSPHGEAVNGLNCHGGAHIAGGSSNLLDHSDMEIWSGSPWHNKHKHSTKQAKASKSADLQVHTKKFYKNMAGHCDTVNTKKRTDISRELPKKSSVVTVESDEDAVLIVNQVETDETMARRLQEEMDREFALSLAETHSPHRPVPHPHECVRSGPVTSGFGVQMQSSVDDSDNDVNPVLLGFPFMSAGNWGERQYALLTGDVLGIGNNWNLESPPQRRMTRQSRVGRRGQTGRMGRRNAVIGLNSPGVNGEDYEALLNLAESLGDAKPKGLTKSQINCLPVKKFVPLSGESAQNVECLVCMCEFQTSEEVRILTCFHDFHAGCIDKWLKNNNTCPICRVEVQLQ